MFPPQDGGEEQERQEGKEERRRETTEEKIKKGPPSAESPAGKMKAILRVSDTALDNLLDGITSH